MKIETYLFGAVEVSPEKVVTFPNADNALLQSPAAEDVLVMQVLFKANEDGKGAITPNLRAPLVINTKARVGLQKVMESMRPNITLSNLASAV